MSPIEIRVHLALFIVLLSQVIVLALRWLNNKKRLKANSDEQGSYMLRDHILLWVNITLDIPSTVLAVWVGYFLFFT